MTLHRGSAAQRMWERLTPALRWSWRTGWASHVHHSNSLNISLPQPKHSYLLLSHSGLPRANTRQTWRSNNTDRFGWFGWVYQLVYQITRPLGSRLVIASGISVDQFVDPLCKYRWCEDLVIYSNTLEHAEVPCRVLYHRSRLCHLPVTQNASLQECRRRRRFVRWKRELNLVMVTSNFNRHLYRERLPNLPVLYHLDIE
jgi:hypothetical protein